MNDRGGVVGDRVAVESLDALCHGTGHGQHGDGKRG